MKKLSKAEQFYTKLLGDMLSSGIPFMIGGTYAFREYTGIVRPTKDLDILCPVEDYPRILQFLDKKGYKTALHEPSWIAKVYEEKHFTDIIYAEKNGLYRVDHSWLEHARQGEILGHMVKLVSPEDMLRSKAYIQFRERHDGADVIHLILKQGRTLNWRVVYEKMKGHWEVLLSHLLMFHFVYPSEKGIIPTWLMQELLEKAEDSLTEKTPAERITRGLLISSQYAVGIAKWGFKNISNVATIK